jgi:hypothetical protein
MALSLTSTAPGTSADYLKYLYDQPIKSDRDGDAVLLDFTLAATDSSFVKLNRGNWIKFQTATYPIWFTGYITNEPEYTYLGEKAGVPHWGYKYEASSDEIILSLNALGIIPPFLNKTQGQILKALATMIAPGVFDYTNIADGNTLARYIVDPTKKFADIVKEFADSAVFRFYGQDHKLHFLAKSSIPQGLTVSGTDMRFTPSALTVKASSDAPIINDAVVIGSIEPQNYAKDYFIGDGFTGSFGLAASAYGICKSVILDDDFSSSTFDTAKWVEFDTVANFIQLNGGFCNFLGGSANSSFDVHLDSAQLIPLSGAVRLTHGDYDFVPQTSDNLVCGVVGGVWTQEPNASYTGCVYGIRVNKSGGIVTLNPIINGVVDPYQYAVIDTTGNQGVIPPAWSSSTTYTVGQKVRFASINYVALDTSFNMQPNASPGDWAIMTSPRYVLRTTLGTQAIFRSTLAYKYIKSDGTIGSYGGTSIPDSSVWTTYITEIDPNTGLVTDGWPKVWNNTAALDSSATYALYIPGASNDLHITLTNVTISTPMQAQLSIASAGFPANWSPTVAYTIGQTAVFNGIVYQALANNTNLQPAAFPADWTTTISPPIPRASLGEFLPKIVGPNEVDSMDGLSPFATVAEAGGTSQKQNILGTPTYNAGAPALTFFKNSTALTTTVPQKGDIIRLTYRSAGVAMGRVRDAASVATEATNWGDNGVRSQVNNGNLTPLPLTSDECEAAAAAIIGFSSYTHYEGKYDVVSENVTSEPLAGEILPFTNLPAGVFVATGFTEPIYQVDTTFLASLNGEVFNHSISFGSKGVNQRLQKQLGKFLIQDTFINPDSAELPVFIEPSSVGTAYAPDITNLELDFSGTHPNGVDRTRIYFQTNQAPPSGGGFEVRYNDGSWGTGDAKNLALRTSSQTFSLSRVQRNSVIFVRAYDNSMPPLYSRYSAELHCAYPNIPAEPTAAVDVSDPKNPLITVLMPGVMENVWGVEVRAADNTTVLLHVDLTDAGFTASVVDAGNATRSLSFYVYTYNLLGEYSTAYNLVSTIPTPTVTGLTVDEGTKTLQWGVNTQASGFKVEIDNTDATFMHIVFVRGEESRIANAVLLVPTTHMVLSDPDFYESRWFRVTAYDGLGNGTPATLMHGYTPVAVTEFNGNEVTTVAAPPTPVSDPTIPTALAEYPQEYLEATWHNYRLNLERY